MLYKDFPLFLDSILDCFENVNKTKTVEEIKRTIFKDEFNKKYPLNTPNKNLEDLAKYVFDKSDYIRFGLEFLDNEKLIVYNKENQTATITPKGFFKVKNESFSSIISDKKVNQLLQRTTVACTIVALFISVYSACKGGNTPCNSCNTEYNKSIYQTKTKDTVQKVLPKYNKK